MSYVATTPGTSSLWTSYRDLLESFNPVLLPKGTSSSCSSSFPFWVRAFLLMHQRRGLEVLSVYLEVSSSGYPILQEELGYTLLECTPEKKSEVNEVSLYNIPWI